MAFKLPQFKFSGMDSKSRVFILLASLVGVIAMVYLAVKYFGTDESVTGPSRVAGAPSGLQSVPGSKELSAEYYRTLAQANAQAVQQAQISGGSAVPTLINTPSPEGGASCTVLCPNEDNANVADDLRALVKAGKLSQRNAEALMDLAQRNVSVAEYAAALDELVRQGKLTPEQARLLLEKYKKQHANALLTNSANAMDGLIKSGQLSLGVANDLLDLQKRKVSPADYAAYLQKLVKDGKLSPEAAAQLLAQYTQQYADEMAKEGAFNVKQMAKTGQITPEIAKLLEDKPCKSVPLNQYEATLTKLVNDGKITPAVAAKILSVCKAQKTGIGTSSLLGSMIAKGGAAADQARRLLDMQANNASLNDYAEELKRAVAAGLLTPEEAADLLRQYQALLTPFASGAPPGVQTVLPGAEDFAKLQRNIAEQKPPTTATPIGADQFATAIVQKTEETSIDRQQQIEQLQTAMATQAQNLLVAWRTPVMKHEGNDTEKSTAPGTTTTTTEKTVETKANNGLTSPENKNNQKPAFIKAGTVAYAVLNTAVDSDYPDTPIMATVVQGPLKGAKLIGKLSLATGKDKVSINFTQIDKDGWPNTRSVSAFAVDPDTARTVMASNVDYHYLKRYGAIMATSFLSGYSSAITQAGTSTTGIFGTSSEHPELSPTSKIAVGLGQIGTNLTSVVQPYVNMPVTVKVNSGVGLGILFVADVTE